MENLEILRNFDKFSEICITSCRAQRCPAFISLFIVRVTPTVYPRLLLNYDVTGVALEISMSLLKFEPIWSSRLASYIEQITFIFIILYRI